MATFVFEYPGMLWLGIVLPCLLLVLGLWGWKAKKELLVIFCLDQRFQRKQQLSKYGFAGSLLIIMIVGLALPKLRLPSEQIVSRSGEILLMVDVSGSMAAQSSPGSPNRLERAKSMLGAIIDRMDVLGEVQISLHGFTSIARSHVPFVGKEDYPYLKESIRDVLGIYSTPGQGTSLGRSILNVLDKFSPGADVKQIVLFSDGEVFIGAAPGMHEVEREWIEEAVLQANQKGIRVITVGVGELAGARVPLRDREGNQMGEYAMVQGTEYYSTLVETCLKEIAARTGGQYFTQHDQAELLDYIEINLKAVNSLSSQKESMDYQVISHWFILLALPFWAITARRFLK